MIRGLSAIRNQVKKSPEYSEITGSLPWLLKTWFRVKPGHEKPPYWQFRIHGSSYSTKKEWNYSQHFSFHANKTCKILLWLLKTVQYVNSDNKWCFRGKQNKFAHTRIPRIDHFQQHTGQWSPFNLSTYHVVHYQLVPKTARTKENSYPRQVRNPCGDLDNSYPRNSTLDNSYPRQLVPRTSP